MWVDYREHKPVPFQPEASVTLIFWEVPVESHARVEPASGLPSFQTLGLVSWPQVLSSNKGNLLGTLRNGVIARGWCPGWSVLNRVTDGVEGGT